MLRWLARAVVLSWIVATLGATILRDVADEPVLELARVTVQENPREVPPEGVPERDSEPLPDEVREIRKDEFSEEGLAPARPLAGDPESGERWLVGERPFPVLSAGYEAFASFGSYAEAMQGLGAQFVVVRGREIVGRANLQTGQLQDPGVLEGFSPRARNYAGEPRIARIEASARTRFGDRAAIRMLVPRVLDAGLFGGIARALAERGESPERFSELRGRYEPAPDGSAWLRIESGTREDGSELSLDLLFHLGDLIPRGTV